MDELKKGLKKASFDYGASTAGNVFSTIQLCAFRLWNLRSVTADTHKLSKWSVSV